MTQATAKRLRIRRYRQAKHRRAVQAHRLLIWLLGDVCAWCGARWDDDQLQVDHVDGRVRANHSDEVRGQNWTTRVQAYWRELWAGVKLQCLCRTCNSVDGRRRQLEAKEAMADCPFRRRDANLTPPSRCDITMTLSPRRNPWCNARVLLERGLQ